MFFIQWSAAGGGLILFSTNGTKSYESKRTPGILIWSAGLRWMH
jgi:hypothetical protein